MNASTSAPGSNGASRASSVSSSRAAASSWRTFPQVNERKNEPSVDGARTPPNRSAMAPCRSRCRVGCQQAGQPPSRTRRAPLSAPGSPAIHAARVTGFAWTSSWQAGQTMSVLRRMRAIEGCPRGLPWPRPAKPLEPGDLVDCRGRALLAQLAPTLEEPVYQLLARCMDRDRGGVLDDRPPVLPQDDPAESRYQVLPCPSRLRLASKHVLGPSPVMTFALWRAAILVTVDLCLAASVFQH